MNESLKRISYRTVGRRNLHHNETSIVARPAGKPAQAGSNLEMRRSVYQQIEGFLLSSGHDDDGAQGLQA